MSSKGIGQKQKALKRRFLLIGIGLMAMVLLLAGLFVYFVHVNQFSEQVRYVVYGYAGGASLISIILILFMTRAIQTISGSLEKQSNAKITSTEGRFKALIQNSLDLITIIDFQGKILYQSPSSKRVLGLSPEDAVGQQIFEWIHPQDNPLMRNVLEQKSSTFFFSIRMQHNDGRWLYFECAGTNLSDNPLIGGIVINSRDITDKKREEEAKRQKELAAIRFNLEKERAEEEKRIIEQQKAQLQEAFEIIEHKNQEIMDSINYAFRIQTALFPDQEEIRLHLPNSFVFWRPKDVVSGDFFWFAQVGQYSIIAASDCTGHGVPGAFMTMIGNTLLNQIVKQEGEVMPDKILNKLHKGVRKSLKQDVTSSKDGMDISFLTIDEANKKIYYAGANNPLIYVRNGEQLEIKADKMSIGGRQEEEERIFTGHELEILPGDKFYIFSDGYQDQFGGPKGRKFMVKKFKQLLFDNSNETPDIQKDRLEKAILDWMGEEHEQVDDILVVGLKY